MKTLPNSHRLLILGFPDKEGLRRRTTMATFLQKTGLRLTHLRRSAVLSTRSFSSEADSLVEVRPGEIGIVSGIPDEHLSRRVCFSSLFILQLNFFLFKFVTDQTYVEIFAVFLKKLFVARHFCW